MGRLSMVKGFRMLQSSILVTALFPFDGGRNREGKKREGFPGAGPALLAVPWVAAVSCN
jgi:hypothetical protein